MSGAGRAGASQAAYADDPGAPLRPGPPAPPSGSVAGRPGPGEPKVVTRVVASPADPVSMRDGCTLPSEASQVVWAMTFIEPSRGLP